ncbi:MAG: DUF523 and DUF1722 domain-containing protein [Deltaproteobacteria bacterium]|nr:DUF523 and DUF1722 domain-containing protein [Deltaproteobacteria bacterium]
MEKIRVGISSCLLGNRVRYDGAHAHDAYLTNTWGQYMEFVPICPEAEAGLGVPREPMYLVGDGGSLRLVTVKTGKDMTRKVEAWARKRVRDLELQDLWGFIFKSNSPSCGMERVKVYTGKSSAPQKRGAGLFARIFREHYPLVPCEEETGLHDPGSRENFIDRVFTLQRWRRCLAQGKGLSRLMGFHNRHRYLLLSHSPKHYRKMEELITSGRGTKELHVYARYGELLVKALALKAAVNKHARVLQHMVGLLKRHMSEAEKEELLNVIRSYSEGLVPLIVPITLLNHYVEKYDQPYLKEQVYLRPHPLELKLRNHV